MAIAEPAVDPPLLAPGVGRRRGSSGTGGGPAAGPRLHWRARATVVLTVLVVALGACFFVLAHWVWAVVLVIGWIVGVIQGRIRVR